MRPWHGMSAPARLTLLLVFYLALTALPLALASFQLLPRRPWPDELASGLGMTALAVLLMEFLLSGRYRAISAGVGMDLTMRFHQIMAQAAAAFVFVHPLLYTLPYSPARPWEVARTATLTLTPAAGVTGVLALILVGVVIALALFRRWLPYSYEAWRLSHGLGALAIAVLGVQHAVDGGRYAQGNAMRVVWLVALMLAIASLFNAYLLKPLRQERRRFRVANVCRAAERIWRIVLEPASLFPFRFDAGQFVWLKFGHAVRRLTEHPFSIASAPAALPRLEFLVKESGDFTENIGRVPLGSAAFVDGPYGNFTLAGRDGAGIVLIAGGVGVAPILSIARELAARGETRPVILIYADRKLDQLVAKDELDHLAGTANFQVRYILAEPPSDWTGLRGIADEANLAACLPREAAADWLYFVCGPPAMIDAVEQMLARRGVPLGQIVSERFRYEGGLVTPRERLTRTVIAGVVGVQLLLVLAFALLRS